MAYLIRHLKVGMVILMTRSLSSQLTGLTSGETEGKWGNQPPAEEALKEKGKSQPEFITIRANPQEKSFIISRLRHRFRTPPVAETPSRSKHLCGPCERQKKKRPEIFEFLKLIETFCIDLRSEKRALFIMFRRIFWYLGQFFSNFRSIQLSWFKLNVLKKVPTSFVAVIFTPSTPFPATPDSTTPYPTSPILFTRIKFKISF